MAKDLYYLIENLTSLDELWTVYYYLRTMKKAPHGGVFHVTIPNALLIHYPFASWSFIANYDEKIPFFMDELIKKATKLYNDSVDLDIDELMTFCFGDNNNWYTGYRLLQIKPEFSCEYSETGPTLIWKIIENKMRFSDYFNISERNAVLGLILALSEKREIVISNLESIISHECLRNPHDKYGLTLVENAKFMREGFQINDTYYLYNIFIDTTIENPSGKMPLTFQIIFNSIPNGQLYMRCDNKLTVPAAEIFSIATVDFQKFHGITLDFVSIDTIIKKQIVVHIHEQLLHKILVIVKPDVEDDNPFFHIEIEELWNPEIIKDSYVMAVFIHAKYFPAKNGFTHIDYSINQYDTDTYVAKYHEAVNRTKVPIDKYSDIHYKIWCVEAEKISIQTWSHLVCATLDEPFREIFLETYKKPDYA